MRSVRRRAGFTLIELVAVVTVLGAMAGVVSLALRPARGHADAGDAWHLAVARARGRALATGRPVHVPAHVAAGALDTLGTTREFTAFPDGSVVASGGGAVDSAGKAGRVERLTGRVFPGAARAGAAYAP